MGEEEVTVVWAVLTDYKYHISLHFKMYIYSPRTAHTTVSLSLDLITKVVGNDNSPFASILLMVERRHFKRSALFITLLTRNVEQTAVNLCIKLQTILSNKIRSTKCLWTPIVLYTLLLFPLFITYNKVILR